MQRRIIRLIINSVIMKRHQHPLIDCIRKRQLIRHIVIADLVNIPAVHSLRRRRQSKQELRPEIIHDHAIRIVDHVVALIDHNIIKIIRRKKALVQIIRLAERLHRSENHRLVRTLIRSPEKAIIHGTADIAKRRRCLIQDLLAVRDKNHPRIWL